MKPFLYSIIIVTGFIGVTYVTGQQILREGANDPQVRVARSSALFLINGGNPDTIVSGDLVDLRKSLEMFTIITDESGKIKNSSLLLDGTTPTPPLGSLLYAKQKGENRITWQPKDMIRAAIVIVPYKNTVTSGYVITGRSLSEIERRERALLVIAELSWSIIVGFILILEFISRKKFKK